MAFLNLLHTKYKILYTLLLSALIIAFLYAQKVVSFPLASAFTMSNANYVIQMGNLNSVAGKSTGPNNKLGITVGEIAPGLYSGTNYKVRAGFQYISSIIRFRFSISNTDINFGVLDPTSPVIRTNTLTISNGSSGGYSVTATESSQLRNPANGALIPDTTCDAGTCTESTSAAWTSTLTFGFGYRCDNLTGTDCASGFSTSTFYKQFPDISKGETPQSVMSGSNVGRNKQVQISYKANVSGTQAAGIYTNVITYVATPTF